MERPSAPPKAAPLQAQQKPPREANPAAVALVVAKEVRPKASDHVALASAGRAVYGEAVTEVPQARLSAELAAQPIISAGLNFPFSPNHVTTSTAIAQTEMKMVEHLRAGDWGALQALIDNPGVKDKPALHVGVEDVRAFFEPLSKRLTDRDWHVLGALAAFHDVGRVSRLWAEREGLDTRGLDGVAHEGEGRRLLENNPQLLDKLALTPDERGLLLDLIEAHTLPGQYFFGEGNLDGYSKLLGRAKKQGSEAPLDLARMQGLVDVFAAMGHRFVKPVLSSHVQLSDTLSTLHASGQEPPAADPLERLSKLTGIADRAVIEGALKTMDPGFVETFKKASSGADSWYGTYAAMAFGSGLIKQGVAPEKAVQTLVKVVACAAEFRRQNGATGPFSLNLSDVSRASMQTLLDETDRITSLADSVARMRSATTGLQLTTNGNDVALGYVTEAVRRSQPEVLKTLSSPLPQVLGAALDPKKHPAVLERLRQLEGAAAVGGTELPLETVNNLAGHLNRATKAELLQLGLDARAADAVIARRATAPLSSLGDLDFLGVPPAVVSVLEVRQKLAQVLSADFPNAPGVTARFFDELQVRLAQSPDKLTLLQAMRDTVTARPEVYLLQGERAPALRLDATRTIDMWPLFQFHFTDEAKGKLSREHGVNDADAFVALAAKQPNAVRELLVDGKTGDLKRDLLQGNVSGFMGVGWWEPSGNTATNLSQVIMQRGLVPSRYAPGLSLVVLDPDDAYRNNMRIPTVFDGMSFNEWIPAGQDQRLGETVGGLKEVVTSPIPLKSATHLLLFSPAEAP